MDKGLSWKHVPTTFQVPLTNISGNRDAVLESRECLAMVQQWPTVEKNS